MAEKQTTGLGPAGEALRMNIKRIREGQRITFVELAERLASVGRPIPILGLRRIEKGERRVDVDDLLAIAYALGVAIIDLLVPAELDSADAYGVAAEVEAQAGPVRAWIRGDAFLPSVEGVGDSRDPFGLPIPRAWKADPSSVIRWMPAGRANHIRMDLLAFMSEPLNGDGKAQ